MLRILAVPIIYLASIHRESKLPYKSGIGGIPCTKKKKKKLRTKKKEKSFNFSEMCIKRKVCIYIYKIVIRSKDGGRDFFFFF